jgi:hypothetical protein
MITRKRLGSVASGGFGVISGSTGVRATLYDLGDRLEIEERDHWMINRRRIPLRDVVLMTRHRFRRIAMGVLSFIPFLLILTIVLVASKGENVLPVVLVCLGVTSPLLAYSLYLLLVPILEIQIQSRRVTARMHFGLRAARGEAIFADLEQRVRAAQAPAQPEAVRGTVIP